MQIILANPRGFCAGVNMAIECLEETIRRFGTEIYVYHEIVHNSYVVSRFSKMGVTFVEHIDEVPPESLLLFSAHGVSPEIKNRARELNLQTIDATCPLVTKVHLEALKYAREEYNIILIGHEGHDEVIGTMGEAPDSITLIEDADSVDQLPFTRDDKLVYLTQTTLSVQEATLIIDRLKERYPDIKSPPKEDICYATTNRQEAVTKLGAEADVVIVLGSQNSSNSKRLMEIGIEQGKRSYLVDGVSELDPEWFDNCNIVLITAGASAPEVVVQECIDYLIKNYQAELKEVQIREENVVFPLPRFLRNQKANTTK